MELTVTDIMVGDIIRYADQDKPQKATIDTLHAIVEGAKVVGVPIKKSQIHVNPLFYFDKLAEIYYAYTDNDDSDVYISFGTNGTDINLSTPTFRDLYGHIHYYHELQHVLRLVGLNELADKLSVE